MTSSIDGLVSGLSTSSMISQLMQVEAAPQTRLKSKVTAAETVVSSYQAVNTKVSAMKTAADTLSQLSTWRAVKPTSSSTSVTATATGGTDAVAGAVKFSVKALATAQSATMRVDTSTEPDPLDPAKTRGVQLNVPDTISITVGREVNGVVTGTPVDIDVSKDKSAKGIQAAINNAGLGVKATLVQVGSNQSVLQLNGAKTGADNAFAVTGLESAAADANGLVQLTTAADAVVEVGGGDATPGGYTLTSGTNTFTGLMAGVSITVGKLEDDVTVTSTSDVSGIAAKFQALVDAANSMLGEISKQTAYDPDTKKGSPLTGDFSVRQMSQQVLSAISQGLSYRKPGAPAAPDPATATQADIDADKLANVVNFGSLSKLGVALDSSGQLTFDAAKFTAAYNADPTAIKEAGTAFADKFEALATTQTANVTSSITGRKNVIDSLNLQIDDWDTRLLARREALQKQYSGLETALSKLQSQSTWLSGQIASLG
ncbi:flagellar filament capping protein FliD [Actinoplanes sp. NPDC049316]|uniref:flagellar filament capping protein FliD n=1 Tax=Actinoplanes sp. NPDC049316 TaxID=3154727 RepID=UPI003438C816